MHTNAIRPRRRRLDALVVFNGYTQGCTSVMRLSLEKTLGSTDASLRLRPANHVSLLSIKSFYFFALHIGF
jgi:hypothetical protein